MGENYVSEYTTKMNGNKSDAIPRSGETKPCKLKKRTKQNFR